MYTITRSITLSCGEKVNVKLIVKEEDRRVIAITDEKICGGYFCLQGLAIRTINKFFVKTGLGSISFDYETKIWKNLRLNDYYRTIAICDPRDEWSDKEGIKVALDKMKDKLNLIISKRLALFFEKLTYDTKKFTDEFFN